MNGAIGSIFREPARVITQLNALALEHGSVHVTGADAVHPDVILPVVNRHRSCQVKHAGFGCAIGGSPRPALQRPSRAGVNDAASTAADHVRNHFPREQIDAFQSYIQDQVPFVFLQFEDSLPNDNSRVVAKDIYFTEALDGLGRGFGAIVAGSNIATDEYRSVSRIGNFRNRLNSTLLVDIEDCD